MIPSFIETQFPLSKISKESYKERKAGASQTLTGLGKWWGRKPLILVRATILGLLMPSGNNPERDREIFLKILTMDDGGLLLRKDKNLTIESILEKLSLEDSEKHFHKNPLTGGWGWKKEITKEQRQEVDKIAFLKLNYDDQLTYCRRPEQIEGPSEEAWKEINQHLGTNATNLVELSHELGKRQFGHEPKVGDAFCGGGSIPFEAARMGCDVYASDLNPAAALLTWAALNIIGGGAEVKEEVEKAQQEVFEKADKQITEWGIEHNEKGWRADAYLYCIEARSPQTGYMVPLAPSWIISEKYKVCGILEPDHEHKHYRIKIVTNADAATFEAAKKGTVQNGCLKCPESGGETPISTLRGDKKINGKAQYGLRLWENEDVVPRPDDVFQERLYCIRYVETLYEVKKPFETDGEKYKKGKVLKKLEAENLKNFDELLDNKSIKEISIRHYVGPYEFYLKRDARVLEILKECFHDWQQKGFIPSMKIERGYNTEQPIRERGWTHWHHLFTSRQLLNIGLVKKCLFNANLNPEAHTSILLGIGTAVDNYSRLCGWNPHKSKGPGISRNVYYNQALNTQLFYGSRSFLTVKDFIFHPINSTFTRQAHVYIVSQDAKSEVKKSDFWITDPPYADAINYHELGDFF